MNVCSLQLPKSPTFVLIAMLAATPGGAVAVHLSEPTVRGVEATTAEERRAIHRLLQHYEVLVGDVHTPSIDQRLYEKYVVAPLKAFADAVDHVDGEPPPLYTLVCATTEKRGDPAMKNKK